MGILPCPDSSHPNRREQNKSTVVSGLVPAATLDRKSITTESGTSKQTQPKARSATPHLRSDVSLQSNFSKQTNLDEIDQHNFAVSNPVI